MAIHKVAHNSARVWVGASDKMRLRMGGGFFRLLEEEKDGPYLQSKERRSRIAAKRKVTPRMM